MSLSAPNPVRALDLKDVRRPVAEQERAVAAEVEVAELTEARIAAVSTRKTVWTPDDIPSGLPALSVD